MATLFHRAIEETRSTLAELGSKVAIHADKASGMGITGLIGAALAQMEYNDRKNELAELYRSELAAQLGKPKENITRKDLETVATVNHTLDEELKKAKKERNVGIGAITAATLASVGIAFLIVPGAGWLATTAVGMLAYMAVKVPIKKLGEAIFKVDKKTTHERIESIHKDHDAGKVISRERVFDIFVHANPPLGAFIEERYGKKFDKLKPVDKLQLADTIGQQLGVSELTDAINQGKIKSTELAFTVEGKFSGVMPTSGDLPKHTFMEKVTEKVQHVAEVVTGHHPANDKPAGFSFAERERQRRANTSIGIGG